MLRRGMLVAGAFVLLMAAHFSGERAEAARNAASDPDELMYLPEGRILRIASLGHANLLADVVWLRAIQYYGEQRLTTRNYDQTERLFTAIYDLDPTFLGATRFGALVLAQDAGDPEGALRLLERGERDFPDRWEYPFSQAFIQHTILRDYDAAGHAYRRAAALPDAPDLAERLAGLSFARLGDRETAREIWRSLLADGNPLTRAVAERNLQNLDLEDVEEALTLAVRDFRSEHDRIPANWQELIDSGRLERTPVDPWGGRFLFVPEADEVLSSTTIDRRMAAVRDAAQGAVDRWAGERGTPPASLGVLVENRLMPEPWSPFGLQLEYDEERGRVAWTPPWPGTEPRNQGEGGTA